MQIKRIVRFRYRLSMYVMTVGIIIAYICFSYGGQLSRKLQLERRDALMAETPGETLGVYLTYDAEGGKIIPQLVEEGISGYIDGVRLYSDAVGTEVLTTVYLSVPEPFPFEVTEGSVPSAERLQDEEPVILLGKGLRKNTYTRDGDDYYQLCGQEYKVLGYVSAENADGLDYIRCLFYENLESKVREEIDFQAARGGLSFVFKSDTKNLMEFYQEKSEQLLGIVEMMNHTSNVEESIYLEDGGLRDFYRYAYLLYLFAIVLVIMVMQLWILQRKKELAIRRAIGFTKGQIILLIAKELLKIILMTGVLCTILQIVVQKILKIGNYSGFDLTSISTALLFIMVTFVLLMIYPVIKITQGDVAETIQNSGRYTGEN